MTGKLALLIAYALCGLLLALWPLSLRPATGAPVADALPRSRALPVPGLFAALLIGALLPWWRWEAAPAPAVSAGELAVVLAAGALCWWQLMPQQRRPCSGAARRAQDLAFAAGVAVLAFLTLPYAHPGVLGFAWHHWSAYIGPAELLLAGARLFLDFPPQYGLGPTLLVAAGCAHTCWSWTYYAVGTATLLFALGVAVLALHAAKPLAAGQRALVLLLAVACCFVWNAYPPLLGSPTATPSVNGFRFLPVVALACLLVLRDGGDERPFPPLAGHAAWAAAAAWSIESAFYATCLWWPYYLLLRHARNGRDPRSLGAATGVLVLVGLAASAAFLGVYGAAYGTLPSLAGLFAYIVDPPGAMPVNPAGAGWFLVAAMALGSIANVRTFLRLGNTHAARHGLAMLLLAYATSSYYLGRSHDNNVLNLLPFVLPVLLHAWAGSRGTPRAFAVGLLACLGGWLATLNPVAWQAGLAKAAPWFDAHWFRGVLPSDDPVQAAFPAATRQVIARVQALVPGPVTVLGPYANASSPAADAVWSALHSPANLHVLAPPVRREFLARTAATLRRSGWLLAQASVPQAMELVADFDTVYARTHTLEMAGYVAIHYAPRSRP